MPVKFDCILESMTADRTAVALSGQWGRALVHRPDFSGSLLWLAHPDRRLHAGHGPAECCRGHAGAIPNHDQELQDRHECAGRGHHPLLLPASQGVYSISQSARWT